jgi:hypothetical protein
MSTPCGKRGFFWEEWDQGTEDWERISVKAPDCPRISKGVLDEARAKGIGCTGRSICVNLWSGKGRFFQGN